MFRKIGKLFYQDHTALAGSASISFLPLRLELYFDNPFYQRFASEGGKVALSFYPQKGQYSAVKFMKAMGSFPLGSLPYLVFESA